MVKAFQEYTEPEDANPSSPQRRAPTAGEDEAVVLPLGENTLTHNLGIPVLIVCTKVNKSFSTVSLVLSNRLNLENTNDFMLQFMVLPICL